MSRGIDRYMLGIAHEDRLGAVIEYLTDNREKYDGEDRVVMDRVIDMLNAEMFEVWSMNNRLEHDGLYGFIIDDDEE